MEFLDPNSPTTWVALAFVIFAVFAYKKLGAPIGRALDSRAARIKTELDEAQRLRKEAEQLLAEYRQKQAQYTREAEAMLADARREADALRNQAEKDLKDALDARMQQALDRIAREESNAVDEVRNHVVDVALAAVQSLLSEQDTQQDELLKSALSEIEKKIH